MKPTAESPTTPQSSLMRRVSMLMTASLLPRFDVEEIPMTLDSLISILHLQPRERSIRQRLFVASYAENVGFFKKLAREEGEHAVKQCVQSLLYECYGEGQYVFRQEDAGDRFYIVLEGKCGVEVETDRVVQEVRTYGPGDSFGELALLWNQPRAASIHCKTFCHFAVLRREDYEKNLHRLQKRRLEEKVEFLLGQPMFKAWSKGAMTKLSYYFYERSYSWKQVVYKTGDPATEIHFIKKGEFRLVKDLPTASRSTDNLASLFRPRLFSNPTDKRKSKKIVEIASLTHGEVIGLDEIFNCTPRSCTCISYSGDAETYVISKEDFFRRMKNEEKIAQVKSLLNMRDKLRSQRLEKREKVGEMVGNLSERRGKSELKTVPGSISMDKFLSIIENAGHSSVTEHPPALKVLKSSRTWDNILRKTLTPQTIKPKRKAPPLVNIHTQGVKLQHALHTLTALQQHIPPTRPPAPTATTKTTTLHIPLLCATEGSAGPAQPLTPRHEWTMRKSSHSLFRPLRTSRC